MTVKNAPDVYEVRNRWLGHDVWMLDEDYQQELVARFDQFIANVKAEALEEAASAATEHMEDIQNGCATVAPKSHAGGERVVSWLRSRAAEYQKGGG